MEELQLKELQSLIIDWGKEKNLKDSKSQYLKIIEETGELARGILKNDIDLIKDSIGDILVTIIIFDNQIYESLDIEEENLIKIKNLDSKELFIELNNLLSFSIKEYSDYKNFDYIDNYNDAIDILHSIALKNDTTIKECLNIAWNEIKDRKGKTINGTFIKNK